MMTVMSVPPGGERHDDPSAGGRHGRLGGSSAAPLPVTTTDTGRALIRSALASWGPDPLAALHRDHYTALVRLATLVVGDVGLAEQITQDAFVKLQLRWGGLRRLDRAPAYLRSAVLNAARSYLRHRRVSDRHDARRTVAPAGVTPESAALGRDERERVIAALRCLPDRQREAVALRYYLDLPEAEIAAAMGVSPGSVKTHLHRGLATLARRLGEDV
jgi:RNA polymerase sigma-70 factor (sigma-E family)